MRGKDSCGADDALTFLRVKGTLDLADNIVFYNNHNNNVIAFNINRFPFLFLPIHFPDLRT